MDKPIKVILVGAGNRAGNVYGSVALRAPEWMTVVGIVDPDPVRMRLMRERYQVPMENCFDDVSELIKREKFADAVINGTMDELHVQTAIPTLEKGYDLLLEKPFCINEEEMKQIVEVANRCKRKVFVCHVLRYAPFYSAIKKHLLNEEIGQIISIEMCEHVSYHHMAVSYVRGKWRSEKLCFTPMLLAKSCHDVDLMMWLVRQKPTTIASFGGEFQFGLHNKPAKAGTRCMKDCPLNKECPFSAEGNYLTNPTRWGQYVWKCLENEENVTIERKRESLSTDNPYGKCVWDFERDGNCDHQSVMVQFENGATGLFNMVGGSAKSERNIHIVGTKGEIKGTFEDQTYVVRKIDAFTPTGYEEVCYNLNETGDMTGAHGGHGGGDGRLVLDFLGTLAGEEPTYSATDLNDSTISHKVVFTAMKAMRDGTVEKVFD